MRVFRQVLGIATNHQIDVDDLSESGELDTFKIVTGPGYLAAGLLTGGNIVIQP